jgi:hypothetical protein
MRTLIVAAVAGLALSGAARAQTTTTTTQGGATATPGTTAGQMAPVTSSNGAAVTSSGGITAGVGTAQRTDGSLQKGPLGSEGGSNSGSGSSTK